MAEEPDPALYIIDGYALIYRSYFTFMNRPLRDMEGNNVSALYGFFNTLLMLLNKYKPQYLVVAMDSTVPTFRHELYGQYKATRDKAPQDLHAQVPRITEILEAAGIPHIGRDGLEADDIIASLVRNAEKEGVHSVVVTGDKDLLQLVGPSVSALRPPRKGEKEYRLIGAKEVEEELGVRADQIGDYLALVGDSSDNIPGVPGIGPKGALKLLRTYGTLDAIYEHLDELPETLAKKLRESRNSAYLSRALVQLRTDAGDCAAFDKNRFSMDNTDWSKAIPYFEKAQAKSLIAAIGGKPTAGRQQGPAGTADNWPVRGTYQAVKTLEELDRLLTRMAEGKILAFDMETTGLDEMAARPVGFSCTNRSFEAWYAPLVADNKPVLPEKEARRLLHRCLVEQKTAIVGQNLKFDYKILARWGIGDVNIAFDTMIAAWLLDAAGGIYNLEYLAKKYLNGYTMVKFTDVVPEKNGQFSSVALPAAVNYAAEDADIAWRLREVLDKQLTERGMHRLFDEVEMPLVRILADMELTGVKLDPKKLEEFDREIVQRIAKIEQEIYDEVGHPFNINSPKQLQQVLFVERKLPVGKKNKTGFSTDTDTLEQLSAIDTVGRLVLLDRALVKLKSTYIDSLPAMINAETGRIHTSYIQTGTATGRLSSRNPNLQNIPIRSEDGRRIREAFVPEEGCLFLSADYSQIELVVLAHLADDHNLKEAFLHGEDIHQYTASLIFSVSPEDVTPQQRRIAKTINFGVMYGMSPFRLANELQISQNEAKNFINGYFARFSSVQAFMQRIRKEAERTGKVATMLGRERFIPEITSRNRSEKSQGERIAVNTVIQGSAADIMKLAMIRVVRRMERERLASRLIMQVHDELIFEVPEKEITGMQFLVREEMEHAYHLSLPLKVSMEVGSSWGQMH